ncbi:hypothetical protein EJ05DRAFT_510258 [Pseudovirgaria hyperparasitica]|uniref:Zn(2)-C6 fungal-type domain-containing protein n=1 Tax=Pseudovirgaria hyperparasitica TaxID=470096 RepID=A0A6A6W7Y6_9PEZI|nr:uncharacterized protein EJ05DRAFT_510258 [Pseudovirgaria hyperparasitica]KAF2758319.1 hypothetical protein EJ05DRAFT_510258 [Pseudovirgaria hyperparasitica]
MSTAVNRKRLACSACTRRKVKCNKEIPCNNCIRKGVQDACTRDDDVDKPQFPRDQSVVHHEATRHEIPHTSSYGSHTGSDPIVVDGLRRRIAELEAALQGNNTSTGRHVPERHLGVATPTAPVAPMKPLPALQRNHTEPSAKTHLNTSEIEDAATILEFLAWGRRKNPDYNTVASSQSHYGINRTGELGDARTTLSLDNIEPIEHSQLSLLQLLLPDPRQLWYLVEYHLLHVLWYHGSFFGPTFKKQLEDFLGTHNGSIVQEGVDLQWVALLFSVLTVSLASAPGNTARMWGFQEKEQEMLSKRWFRAVMICLNIGEYTMRHSVHSVQAIATLTLAAHTLGYSNNQSVLLAAATKLAQGLGLHKLNNEARGSVVEKETGRRTWLQLCTQDWFSIPFSEAYLINPLYSTSELPKNCNDDDMESLPESIPTMTSFCRVHSRLAALMPRLQDALSENNTPYTKYEQVIRFDKEIRNVFSSGNPLFQTDIPMERNCPHFVPWARRALAISGNHKIIMVHRKFLGPSFTNPAFAFTRRTCLNCAKTIIREYKAVVREDGPVFWIHQAFSVAAAIILSLDILYRQPADKEYGEHRRLIEEANEILQNCHNSMIAIRGARLLTALLKEAERVARQAPEFDSNKRKADTQDHDGASTKRVRGFDVTNFVKRYSEGHGKKASEQQQPDASRQHPTVQQQHHEVRNQHHLNNNTHAPATAHPYYARAPPPPAPPAPENDISQAVPYANTFNPQFPNTFLPNPTNQVELDPTLRNPQDDMHGGMAYAANPYNNSGDLVGPDSFSNLLYLANNDVSFNLW